MSQGALVGSSGNIPNCAYSGIVQQVMVLACGSEASVLRRRRPCSQSCVESRKPVSTSALGALMLYHSGCNAMSMMLLFNVGMRREPKTIPALRQRTSLHGGQGNRQVRLDRATHGQQSLIACSALLFKRLQLSAWRVPASSMSLSAHLLRSSPKSRRVGAHPNI